jgi:acetyl-CoA acetyltransferase
MSKAYIVGAFMTAFGKRPDISFKALTAEAYEGVLAHAGLPDGAEIASTWFGNCGLQAVGQGSVRGQICLSPLVASGRFPVSVPVINVENACATGSTAFHGALTDIISGRAHVSLALGVEKLFNPNPSPQSLAGFMAGADMLDPERWQGYYREVGEALGHPFVLGSDRSPFMDTYAMQALWHMGAHGTTERQIAAVAAKSHNNGALNPKAQYRFPMTIEEVLADRGWGRSGPGSLRILRGCPVRVSANAFDRDPQQRPQDRNLSPPRSSRRRGKSRRRRSRRGRAHPRRHRCG